MNSPVKVWRNQKTIASLLGKEGRIVSWTIIRVPPTGFSILAPYFVVVIELEDKKCITAQLVDAQKKDVSFGKKVKIIVRRVSDLSSEDVIPYGIKVKLI